MVSVKNKTIGCKKYIYAEHSFRLPNGKIKKISKLIQKQEDKGNKEVKGYFLKKNIISQINPIKPIIPACKRNAQ